MTADLQWMLLKNDNCFLRKGLHGEVFSAEPNNLKGLNTLKNSGLVHRKTVGVEPSKDGKGVTLVIKKSAGWRKPIKNYHRMELKSNPRKTLAVISRHLKKKNYRSDLKKTAMRRASAILKSQKPVVAKKTQRKKRDAA